MLADVGSVELARHADRFELSLRADAGQHEDVGRPHRSSAEHDLLGGLGDDDLAVGGPVLDPGCPQLTGITVQDDSGHVRPADHLEVRSLLDIALEERVIRTGPLPGASGRLQERNDPVRTAAVTAVVVATRNPCGDRRVDEVLCADEHRCPHRHAEGTLGVVGISVDDDVAARRQPLALLEVGQHVVVAPPGGTVRGPGVEVARMASDVRHVVDAGRTAEHLAARHHHSTVGETETAAAGVGRVHPVGVGVHLQHRAGGGHQRLGWRRATGLQKRDSARRILREPGRDDGAGRPTPHHDEVKRLGHTSGT